MPTLPRRMQRGCSPWAIMGCGCGFIGTLGILLVFVILALQTVKANHDSTWNRASYAQCQENLVSIGHAIHRYEKDFHHLPATLRDLSPQYVDNPNSMRCPLEMQEKGRSYQYQPLVKSASDVLVSCDNHGQGRVCLLHDGHMQLPSIFHIR